MATKTISTDDLSGETLPQDHRTTVITISDPRWDAEVGETFELDLSDTSFKTLIKALEKFSGKARPATLTPRSSASVDAEEAKAARAWAIANRPELKVSERGKVPMAAIVAYRAHLDNTDTE